MTRLIKWLALLLATWRARRELAAMFSAGYQAGANREIERRVHDFGEPEEPAHYDWSTWDRERPS